MDLGCVNVDVNDAGSGCERFQLARHTVIKAYPKSYEEVGL